MSAARSGAGMADAYCLHCGEPWDTYEFHDIAVQYDVKYRDIWSKFKQVGCGLFDGAWGDPIIQFAELEKCKTEEPCESKGFLEGAAVIYELSGNDSDGAISGVEDMRRAGMF